MDTPRKISISRGGGRPPLRPPAPLVVPNEPIVNTSQFNNAEPAAINAVAIKRSKLWTNWVRRWFAKAEAQLATMGLRPPGPVPEDHRQHPSYSCLLNFQHDPSVRVEFHAGGRGQADPWRGFSPSSSVGCEPRSPFACLSEWRYVSLLLMSSSLHLLFSLIFPACIKKFCLRLWRLLALVLPPALSSTMFANTSRLAARPSPRQPRPAPGPAEVRCRKGQVR